MVATVQGAIDSALAYGKCYLEKSSGARLSCFLSKVLGTFQATMYICIPASQLHAWDNMAVLLFVHIAILKGTWLQVEQTNLMKWSKGSGTGECGSWISKVSARSCQHRGWCSSRVWYPRNSGWGKCTCSLSLACSLSVNSMIYLGRETHHSCLDHIAVDLKLIEFRSDMLPYPIESHPSFQYDTNICA